MKIIEVDVSYRGTTTRMPARDAALLMKDRQGLTRRFNTVLDGDILRAEHRDGGTMIISRHRPQKAREGDDDNPPSPDDDMPTKPRQVQFEIPVAFPLEIVGAAYVMAESREQARELVADYAAGCQATHVNLDFGENSLMDLRHKLNALQAGQVRTCGHLRVAGEPEPATQYLLTHG